MATSATADASLAAESQAEYKTNRNLLKLVNQLEIYGKEKRIPDGIIPFGHRWKSLDNWLGGDSPIELTT